jgi:hypothetical protein
VHVLLLQQTEHCQFEHRSHASGPMYRSATSKRDCKSQPDITKETWLSFKRAGKKRKFAKQQVELDSKPFVGQTSEIHGLGR